MKDKLKDLIDVFEDVKKQESDLKNGEEDDEDRTSPFGPARDDLIKSHSVFQANRLYYLDLKRNRRGHFLRLTMVYSPNRVQIAVPSQGMSKLHDAMSELLEKWWDGSKQPDSIGMLTVIQPVSFSRSKPTRIKIHTY